MTDVKCSKCGYNIPEDSVFCPFCGSKIISPPTKSGTADAPEFGLAEKQGKGGVKKATATVCAVVLACVGIGGTFGFLYGGQNVHTPPAQPEKEPEQNAAVEEYVDPAVQERYDQAMTLMEKGDYLAALEAFEAIESHKDSETMMKTCWLELGKRYAEEKDYDEALVHLLKADEADAGPLLVECYYQRMMRGIEAEDWETAYTNCKSGLRYEGPGRIGLEEHRYQVYTEYARLKISGGTEQDCKKAIEALDPLIGVFGETDELKKLRQEAKYLSAAALWEEKEYTAAIEQLADILDYKDSRDMWLAYMDQFVRKIADYGAQSPVFAMYQKEVYDFARILSDQNYNGNQVYYSDVAGLAR